MIDVELARRTIAGRVHRTPTFSSQALGAHLKAELFQKTGSFKARGALNRIAALTSEEREHAFERFYLHERYGRERPVGTGLGLAIVKELTEAMGGSVEVASAPGRLTTFAVHLAVPAREPAPAA